MEFCIEEVPTLLEMTTHLNFSEAEKALKENDYSAYLVKLYKKQGKVKEALDCMKSYVLCIYLKKVLYILIIIFL